METFLAHRCQNLIAGWWISSETHLSICRLSDYQIVRLSGRHQNPFLKTAICILSFVRPVKFIQVFAALGVTELFTFDRISFPLVQKGKAVPEQSKGNSSSWLKKQSLGKAGQSRGNPKSDSSTSFCVSRGTRLGNSFYFADWRKANRGNPLHCKTKVEPARCTKWTMQDFLQENVLYWNKYL